MPCCIELPSYSQWWLASAWQIEEWIYWLSVMPCALALNESYHASRPFGQTDKIGDPRWVCMTTADGPKVGLVLGLDSRSAHSFCNLSRSMLLLDDNISLMKLPPKMNICPTCMCINRSTQKSHKEYSTCPLQNSEWVAGGRLGWIIRPCNAVSPMFRVWLLYEKNFNKEGRSWLIHIQGEISFTKKLTLAFTMISLMKLPPKMYICPTWLCINRSTEKKSPRVFHVICPTCMCISRSTQKSHPENSTCPLQNSEWVAGGRLGLTTMQCGYFNKEGRSRLIHIQGKFPFLKNQHLLLLVSKNVSYREGKAKRR